MGADHAGSKKDRYRELCAQWAQADDEVKRIEKEAEAHKNARCDFQGDMEELLEDIGRTQTSIGVPLADGRIVLAKWDTELETWDFEIPALLWGEEEG